MIIFVRRINIVKSSSSNGKREVLLLDVRPIEEYGEAQIPDAVFDPYRRVGRKNFVFASKS